MHATRGFLQESRGGGWKMLVAALVGVMLGITALPFYSLGVLSQPIADDFGWTRADVQSGLGFQMAGTVVIAWAAGLMIDRVGARKVALSSQAGLAVAFFILANQTGDLAAWRASWFMLALLGIGTAPLTWSRGVVDWFDGSRGMALGIALSGSGITAAVAPPLLDAIVTARGWRAGYLAMSAMMLFVGLPLTWLLFRTRADQKGGGTPDGNGMPVSGLKFRQALGGYRFWLILIGFSATHFTISGLIPNLVPILQAAGVAQAALYSGFLGVAIIVGRLVTGVLVDRIWAPLVTAILLALPAAACLLLWNGIAPAAAAILIGLAAGAEFDLIAFLCARYFGMRSYGRIYSWLWTGFAIATGLGAYVFARIIDAGEGHRLALLLGAILILAGAGAMLLLGRYPRWDSNERPRPSEAKGRR